MLENCQEHTDRIQAAEQVGSFGIKGKKSPNWVHVQKCEKRDRGVKCVIESVPEISPVKKKVKKPKIKSSCTANAFLSLH